MSNEDPLLIKIRTYAQKFGEARKKIKEQLSKKAEE